MFVESVCPICGQSVAYYKGPCRKPDESYQAKVARLVRTPMWQEENDMVDSASDERVVNNSMRHQYRVLSDAEKQAMMDLKDIGLRFALQIELSVPVGREASIAKTKVDEAVMWAVRGLTG